MERSKPILFSAPMVRAILSDAKTQTRRVVKPAPPAGADPRWTWCAGSTDRRDVGAFHYGVLAPDGQTFTDASGSSFSPWPTPTHSDGEGGAGHSGRDGGMNLRTAAKQWPTPAARDWKDNGDFTVKTSADLGGKGVPLPHAAGGELNADWTEPLMGFPAGWTRIDGPPAAAKRNTSGKHRASRRASPNDASG